MRCGVLRVELSALDRVSPLVPLQHAPVLESEAGAVMFSAVPPADNGLLQLRFAGLPLIGRVVAPEAVTVRKCRGRRS